MSTTSAAPHGVTLTAAPPSRLTRSKRVQVLLAILICVSWLADILCLFHEGGGMSAAEVRHWYHAELRKNMPSAPEKILTESPGSVLTTVRSKSKDGGLESLEAVVRKAYDDEQQGSLSLSRLEGVREQQTSLLETTDKLSDRTAYPVILDGGITKYSDDVRTEFADDVCAVAERAVAVRKNARYDARKRGTILHRMVLFVRDAIKYKTLKADFEFAAMKEKQRRKLKCGGDVAKEDVEKGINYEDRGEAAASSASSTAAAGKCSDNHVCFRLYENAAKTNAYYNKVLDGGGKDFLFGAFHGYTAFVVEATSYYVGFVLILMTTPAADEQLSSTPPYPNPPLWPADSVTILRPDDEQPPGQKQQILDELFTDHGRYSVDSAKGTFRERPDGYYMHVLGLGVRRNDTKIGTVQVLNGSPDFRIGALVNFWRKAENFHTDNDLNWWVSQASTLRRVSINGNLHLSGMDWASFNFGFASGGFLADVEVGTASGGGGVVNAGSQQQFCFRNIRTRNPELEKDAFRGGAWNFVFIGSPTVVGQHGAGVRDEDVVSTGASSGSDQKLTVIDTAPIIAEKPFIVATRTRRRRSTSTIDRDYLYHIVVPPAVHNRTTDSSPVVVPGGSWHRDEAERPAVQELLLDQSANHEPAVEALGEHEEDEQVEDDASRLHRRWSRVVSFDRVYVAEPPAPDEDITIAEATVDRINEALSTTGSVVLTPGIYRLAKPIVLSRPKSVLLGIGLATLVCEAASPCLLVHNSARGSRVSGLIVQPGVTFSGEVLVEVGTSGDEADERTSEAEVVEPRSAEEDAEEHIFLYDVFARVGGDTDSRRETVNVSEAMMRIRCSRVVLDNIWLWRADHDVGGAVRDGRNFVKNALQVFGERVTFYGLAAEHALDDQVVWKGNFGRVYFFQSEFAYDLEAPVTRATEKSNYTAD
eukprot:g9534.t1